MGGKVGFKRKLSLFTLYTVLSVLFFFFFNNMNAFLYYLLTYFLFLNLAVLALSCSTWDLYSQHVGSSSLTRDRTQAPCTGSSES